MTRGRIVTVAAAPGLLIGGLAGPAQADEVKYETHCGVVYTGFVRQDPTAQGSTRRQSSGGCYTYIGVVLLSAGNTISPGLQWTSSNYIAQNPGSNYYATTARHYYSANGYFTTNP